MKPSLTAGLCGLALAPVLASQPGLAAPPVFRVALEMVYVTVTAHDAKGQLVADLGAEDFGVREDGRPQTVQVFGAAAGQLHTGEKAPLTGDLRCARCGEMVRVVAGQPIPACPRDHHTFDMGEREELALNLGMLFDTSESMVKEIKLSQESAMRFLDAIPRAKDRLLIFFDSDIRISRYNSENQQGIFGRILDTEGSGQTALNDAIAVYLSRIAETPGRKVLVVFSDGDDTTSRVNSAQVASMLRASDVVVYPVAFVGERPNSAEGMRARAFLASLAEMSGGRVFAPRASQQLAAIYTSILEELGSQYVLGYVSDNAMRDGRFRKLVVDVKRPGIRLRYRPGYVVPKDGGRGSPAR